MNPFRPTVTELLLHRPTGEFQPRSIQPDAVLRRIGDPDQHGRLIGGRAEPFFAGAPLTFDAFAIGDVERHAVEAPRRTVGRVKCPPDRANPFFAPCRRIDGPIVDVVRQMLANRMLDRATRRLAVVGMDARIEQLDRASSYRMAGIQ
jgi:hypothetical protein